MSEYPGPSDYHAPDEVGRWVLFCGRLAPFFSILLFLSPIPTIRQILQTGTVGQLPLLPYTSMAGSTFVWVVYGILKGEPLIWATNLVEFVLSIYYFVEFTNYADPNKSDNTIPLGNVVGHIKLLGGVVVWTMLLAIMNQPNWIGDTTVLLSIIMFASPLAALKAVVESQSAAAIPLPFTVATLMNCALWTIVGVWEMHDIYVYFPEVLGLLGGFAQVVLKCHYGDGDGEDVPTFHHAQPVKMSVPILGQLRNVVMMGNNSMDGGSSLDNNPQSLLGNMHYSPLGTSE